MAHLALFRFHVSSILGHGLDHERYALGYRDPVTRERGELLRIVAQQSNARDTEIPENVGADSIVAAVLVEAKREVGLHRVESQFLKLVGPQLVEQSDATSL